MKKTIYLLVMAVLWLNIKVSAQQLTELKGQVTGTFGKPLAGATIKIKSGTPIAKTDKNGVFTIKTSVKTGTLTISFLGYETKEVPFDTKKAQYLTITLQESHNFLDQVSIVSTGYQNIPRERATGSFTTPDKAILEARVSPTVLSRLEGITSGLVFNSRGKGVNQSIPDLSIRGRSTIYSNDQPIIVVDNFPYNGNINDLNPQDIASINILKDAAAASIWGVKAGNGVIVITTKKGKLDQKTEITLNANLTIGQKPNLHYDPNFLNSPAYIDLQQYLFRRGRFDSDLINIRNYPAIPSAVEIMAAKRNNLITKEDSTARIDQLKSIDIRDGLSRYYYQNPFNQQYALNISSGGSQSSHYFSVGYDNIRTSQKSIKNERITLNYSNTYQPVKSLEITTQLNYVIGNSDSSSPLSLANASTVANLYFPYIEFADNIGLPLKVNRGYSNSYLNKVSQNNFLNWDWIPLNEFGANQTKNKTSDSRLFAGAKYTIWKGLSAEAKYQYQYYTSKQTNLQGLSLYNTRDLINRYSSLTNGRVSGYNIPIGDILNLSNATTTSNNIRGQLNYSQSGKHTINAIIGAELIEYRNKGENNRLYGYDQETGNFSVVNQVSIFPLNPRGNGIIGNGDGTTSSIDRYRSFFSNAGYTYNQKYTLSASARLDGSNYFGVATNLKTVPLWSIGAKWAISNERFYPFTWLPSLQFRATYGYNGNLNKSVTGVTTFQYQTNSELTGLPYSLISNIGNPLLRWEKIKIINLGLEFGTNNNFLSGSIEYYFKKGIDLIGNQVLAPSIGYVNPSTGTYALTGNFASMKGQGLDLQLNTRNLSGQLSWNTTANLSYTTDKVTKYDLLTTPNFGAFTTGGYDVLPIVGKPVYALYSYKWAGLDPNNGDPRGYLNGSISKDYNALVAPTSISELVYEGPSRPLYFGGISNRLSYKGFSMMFTITFKLGYYFRSSTINYAGLFGSGGGHQDYNLRWQKTGDELITNIPSMVYPADSNRDLFYQNSEPTIDKADHIRLNDIYLGYDFIKGQKNTGSPFKKIQVFTYTNNLGILWRANKKGLDPDFPTGGIPPIRTIAIGLKAHF